MSGGDCVFCDLSRLRVADVYIENDHCVYASTRDPRDPPDVLPGCGVIVPRAHRSSPFDFSAAEWAATHELLLAAKSAQDDRLEPDGYTLVWNCWPEIGHAHLHVLPRFDDEPLAELGGRSAIKAPENRRPHPFKPGTGRARLFGRPYDLHRIAGAKRPRRSGGTRVHIHPDAHRDLFGRNDACRRKS
jgi:histidine triad (HIT) family protein